METETGTQHPPSPEAPLIPPGEPPQTGTGITEEDAAKFPPELMQESRQRAAPTLRSRYNEWFGKMSVPDKVRLATLGNQDARAILMHDPDKVIPLAVLRNPKVNETEVLGYCQLRDLPGDVFWEVSKHKTWIKNYPVKLALVSNPRTPLPLAIRLLDHLHDGDLKNLSRSKNVSSVLSRSATRLLFKRRG